MGEAAIQTIPGGELPQRDRRDGDSVDVSIVIPTLNEAANLPALLHRIDVAMGETAYEVVVVDDASRDGTVAVCARLAEEYPLQLHVRDFPVGGLSGAVLLGLSLSRGNILVVMDGDLQHPPECLPALVAPLREQEADFVLGSRYVAGGRILDFWGLLRRLNSRVATLLAAPLAGAVRDPMSGFFALRRDLYEQAKGLNPLGYKIGLELLCKCPVRRLREIPIHFGVRSQGSSKLTLSQQLAYLAHLVRLYEFRYPLAVPLVIFALLMCLAWVPALALWRLLTIGGLQAVSATILAYSLVLGTSCLARLFAPRAAHDMAIPQAQGRGTMTFAGEWLVCAGTALAVGTMSRPGSVGMVCLCFGAAAALRGILCLIRPLPPLKPTQDQRLARLRAEGV